MQVLTGSMCVFGLLLLIALAQEKQPTIWTNAELEAAITQSIAQGKPVTLPAKIILDKTVHLGLKSSIRFVGGGGTLINYNQASVKGRTGGTRIFWKGPVDQPIFMTAGVGNEWSGIAFILDNPTSACIHVVKGSGLGTGKHLVDSCSFLENPLNKQSSVGLLMGVTVGDGNCDESTLRNCVAVDMKSMFRSVNNQSVGNRFYGNFSNRNLVAFDFVAGGKVAVFGHSSVRDQTVLKLGQQGSGNNNFCIYGLSVDAAAPAGWLLIDNTLARDIFVTIEGHLSSQAGGSRMELIKNDNPLFDLAKLAGVKATNGQQ